MDSLQNAERLYDGVNDNNMLYRVGLRHAERGDIKTALEMFSRTNLADVDTHHDLFYHVIADSVFSFALLKPNFDPEGIRATINTVVKDVIKSVTIQAEPFEVEVDFGDVYYTYTREGAFRGRNHVDVFAKSKTTRQDTAIKTYTRRELQEAEAFWLTFLEDKVPLKRLLSTGRFDGLYYNEIERCGAVSLASVLGIYRPEEREKVYASAINLLFGLGEALSKGREKIEAAEAAGTISTALQPAYLERKFTELYEHIHTFGSDAAREVLDELPHVHDDVMHTLLTNRNVIVPHDYTPRNIMTENGALILIDHEDYKQGHVLTPVMAFARNPEIGSAHGGERKVIEHAYRTMQKYEITTQPELAWAAGMFYSVRRAGALAVEAMHGNREARQHAEWHLERLREGLHYGRHA